MPRLDLISIDDGIRDTVISLRMAGYHTFTSCEGGKGHAFSEPTVGLNYQGDYFAFRDRLVKFLYSHRRRLFEIILVSSYDHNHLNGKHYVYLKGFDIASPEKRKSMSRSIRQLEQNCLRQLEQNGLLDLD